jgi:hypothetical protein
MKKNLFKTMLTSSKTGNVFLVLALTALVYTLRPQHYVALLWLCGLAFVISSGQLIKAVKSRD